MAGESGCANELVIFRVLLAVILQRGIDLLAQSLHTLGRLPGNKQRPDLGADKMVGTAGAQMRQRFGLRRIHEAQDFRQIAEVADQAPGARDPSAQERKNIERKIAPISRASYRAPPNNAAPFFSTWSTTNCPS